MLCPCKSNQEFHLCCEPFLKGEQMPMEASQLMRARYSAYTLGDIDFVRDSHDPETRGDFDYQGAKDWAQKSKWLGLRILDRELGSADDQKGSVEFIASFADQKGNMLSHHEQAYFTKIDNRWYYSEGDMVTTAPITRENPKIGRNDPCHCGSGKKYKKCHGN